MPAFTPVGAEAQLKNLGAFMSDIRRMDNAIANSGKTTDGAGNAFVSLGQKVGKFGALAAGAVVTGVGAAAAAITAFGIAGTRAAISYESAFTGVLKTTDGLVDSTGKLNQAGEQLRRGFIDLSKEIPVTPEALARIGELGGQLGIQKENLLGFTRTMADLGVTTNLTTEEAATQFARLANIMQTPQDQFENLGSATVALGNNFATTESEIVTFAERIAGAGQISGLTEADVLAIGAAMSSVGVQAEAGGTAVQKVLLAMSEAVQGSSTGFVDNTKAIDKNVEKLLKLNAESARLEATLPGVQAQLLAQFDAFTAAGGSAEEFGRQLGDKARQKAFLTALQIRELTADTETLRAEQGKPIQTGALTTFAQVAGVTAEEFKRLWQEDAGQAFQLFVEGLGAQGDAAFGTLEKLELGDQRLIRSFLSLSNAGDLLANTMDLSTAAFAENTALTKEAELRYATTESKLILMKNAFRATAITLWHEVLPAFDPLIEAATQFASTVGETLLPKFQEFGAWLADRLPVAIETAMGFWNDTLLPGLQAAGQFIQTDVVPAVQALVSRFSGFGDTIQQVASVVGPFIAEHAEGLKGALIAIGAVLAGAGLAAALPVLIAGVGSAIAALASPIGIIIIAAGTLGAAWAENWGGIRDKTQAVVDFLMPIFEDVQAWLAEKIPVAVQAASDFWENTLLPAIQDFTDFVKSDVIPAAMDIASWLQEKIPLAIQAASDFWNDVLLPAIQDFVNFVNSDVIPAVTEIVTWLQTNIPIAIQAASDVWENVLQPAFSALSDFITQFLIPAFQEVAAFIEDPLIPLFTAISELVSAVAEKVGEALAGAWQNILLPALEDVWDFIDSNILPIFASLNEKLGISKTAAEVYEDALDGMRKTFQKIRDILGGLTQKISSFTEKVKDFKLPDILTPGSPTPFELALRGIADAMDHVVDTAAEFAAVGERLGADFVDAVVQGIEKRRLTKSIGFLLGRAASFAKLGGGFAQVFERQTVTPLEDETKRLEDIVADSQKRIADMLSLSVEEFTGGFSDFSLQAALGEKAVNQFGGIISRLQSPRLDLLEFVEQLGTGFRDLIDESGNITDVSRAASRLLSTFDATLPEFIQRRGVGASFFESLFGVSDINTIREALSAISGAGDFLGRDLRLNFNSLVAAQDNLNKVTEDYRKEQERLLALEEKRQQLNFLQQQLDLIELVREKALDKNILEGITFGLEADAGGLLDAMTRATTALIARASDELGIASPSAVFARIGQQISAGLAVGITSGAGMVNQAIAAAIPRPQVAAPVAAPAAGLQTMNTFNLGGNTINSGMDAATLDARITRAVARAL